jgi:hypothetical protein
MKLYTLSEAKKMLGYTSDSSLSYTAKKCGLEPRKRIVDGVKRYAFSRSQVNVMLRSLGKKARKRGPAKVKARLTKQETLPDTVLRQIGRFSDRLDLTHALLVRLCAAWDVPTGGFAYASQGINGTAIKIAPDDNVVDMDPVRS